MGDRVLFVDDEKAILKAIERLFFDSGYEVMTADSGEAGLKILAETQVDIVVSDIRMPTMDGHQFLRQVRTLYPRTSRLILSGYAEESAILDSIVDGSSNMYLLKPWDGQDLREKIDRISATRRILCSHGLLAIANRLDNLAVTPHLYSEVAKLIEEGADIGSIAGVIETDPAVAAAVLRVANSAFLGVHTASVSKAITFLGLSAIKTIVLSCSLFQNAAIRIPPFSVKRLTAHANKANYLLGLTYADLLKKPLPDTHQTAGLLCNLGLLMCLNYFPEKYQQIFEGQTGRRTKRQLVEEETKVLGANHQEVGGYLLHWWGLPYPVVEAALFHHDPLNAAIINRELVAAIHVANYYAWQAVYPELAEIDPAAFDLLGVSQSDCRQLLNKA
jgi:HD-like signal output (HDOD) protein